MPIVVPPPQHAIAAAGPAALFQKPSRRSRRLCLVTSFSHWSTDDDMPFLLAACESIGLCAEVRAWDDPGADWSSYDHVVLRSPWDLIARRAEFLAWCARVSTVTDLVNPASAARWSTDKHYLADLAARGVPIVPTAFVEPGEPPAPALRAFLDDHKAASEFVVKPTIGCNSNDVRRFARADAEAAVAHARRLAQAGHSVIAQPYMAAIDAFGETNLIYFEGVYSHAIRKSALLLPDGTVNEPANEFRAARAADPDERALAEVALAAAAAHLGLSQPLLYARVDLVRGDDGLPVLLELEICEPSLSLRFSDGGALRFAEALARMAARACAYDMA